MYYITLSLLRIQYFVSSQIRAKPQRPGSLHALLVNYELYDGETSRGEDQELHLQPPNPQHPIGPLFHSLDNHDCRPAHHHCEVWA